MAMTPNHTSHQLTPSSKSGWSAMVLMHWLDGAQINPVNQSSGWNSESAEWWWRKETRVSFALIGLVKFLTNKCKSEESIFTYSRWGWPDNDIALIGMSYKFECPTLHFNFNRNPTTPYNLHLFESIPCIILLQRFWYSKLLWPLSPIILSHNMSIQTRVNLFFLITLLFVIHDTSAMHCSSIFMYKTPDKLTVGTPSCPLYASLLNICPCVFLPERKILILSTRRFWCRL